MLACWTRRYELSQASLSSNGIASWHPRPANCHGQLAKYPSIVNLERSTGVPKAYAVIGAASLYLFLILLNLGGQLLTNVAGFAIPGYYSMAALFTSNTDDDTQWLTVRRSFPIAPLSRKR